MTKVSPRTDKFQPETPGESKYGRPRRPAASFAVPQNLPSEVQSALRAYVPSGVGSEVWLEIGEFVLSLLHRTLPETVGEARRQVMVLSRYAGSRLQAGVPLTSDVMFTSEEVETQIATWRERGGLSTFGPNVSPNTLGTYASVLRRLGPLIYPNGGWRVAGEQVSRTQLRMPYTDEEVDLILRATASHPNATKREVISLAVHFILGTGATPQETRRAVGSDIRIDNSGVVVARFCANSGEVEIPVAEPHVSAVLQGAEAAADGPLLDIASGANALARLLNTDFGAGVPPIQSSRLRTTWFVRRVRAGVSIKTLPAYARLTSSTFLIDVARYLPDPRPAEDSAALVRDPANPSTGLGGASWTE